jgi:hypothetical protein
VSPVGPEQVRSGAGSEVAMESPLGFRSGAVSG